MRICSTAQLYAKCDIVHNTGKPWQRSMHISAIFEHTVRTNLWQKIVNIVDYKKGILKIL